jgi:hypothetical protein
MSLISNIEITSGTSSVNTISTTGSYIITFNLGDIAQNYLDGVNVT